MTCSIAVARRGGDQVLFATTQLHVDIHCLITIMVPRFSHGGLDAQMQGAISVKAGRL